eukprot:1879417-Pleurochrysis_carterae.AAC.1
MEAGLFKATVTLVKPLPNNVRSLQSCSRKASAFASDAVSRTASQAFKAMGLQTYHRIFALPGPACSSARRA